MKLRNLGLCMVFLTLSSVGRTMQLSDIRAMVRIRLRDSANDVSFQRFTDATVDSFINESQRDFVSKTLLMSNTTDFGLTAGQIEYDLPSDYLTSIRVTISSQVLTQTSISALDQDATNWTIATSTPTEYYVTANTSSTTYRIGFYPKPSVTSVNTVHMFYYQQAQDLVANTDVPFGSKNQFVPYHLALVDYATAIGWLVQGRMDLAKPFLDLYQGQVDVAKRNLGFMPDYNPGFRGDRGPRQ